MPGMMDKGSDYLGKGRSNGTKSPSNASNGHFSDESGSDDEHGEYSLEQPVGRRVCVWARARSERDCVNLTSPVVHVDVFQMLGCGSEPTTRPASRTSSPVSRILPERRTVVASVHVRSSGARSCRYLDENTDRGYLNVSLTLVQF